MLVRIIIIIFITSLVFFANQILSYDNIIIHPSLTRASAEIYNKQADKKLTKEQIDLIVEGTIAEDTDPRYFNHFYNPKTNKGLNDGIFFGESAKSWAHEQDSISGDYSIGAILENYKQENFKRAYQGIGHILHLTQDMAQPAHTRNDSHGFGDPYEEWAEQYGKINLSKVKFVKVNNIDNVIDNLAHFSHDNFFSKDTVEIDDVEKYKKEERIFDNKKKIYLINSIGGNDYKIAFLDAPNLFSSNFSVNDFRVYLDYWNILAPKAIGNGAGVIDFFIKEFEKIDDQRENEEEMSLWQKIKNTISKTSKNIKYKYGDTLIVAGINLNKRWNNFKESIKTIAQNVGFFGQASQETIIDASKKSIVIAEKIAEEAASAAEDIMKDTRLFVDQEILEFNMTIMPVMSVIPEIAMASPLVLVNHEDDKQEEIIAPIPKIIGKIIDKEIETEIEFIKDVTKIDIPVGVEEIVELVEETIDEIEIIKLESDSELHDIEKKNNIPEIIAFDKDVNVSRFEGFSAGFVPSSGSGIVAPDTFIIASPNLITTSTYVNFVFASNQGDVVFLYKFDDGSWISTEKDELIIDDISDGEHLLEVKAKNSSYVDSTPVQYVFIVDSTAPDIVIKNAPGNFASSTNANFFFTSQEEVFWTCLVDDVAQACNASTTIVNLEQGSHNLKVWAQDIIGNISSTTYDWLVDTESPTIVINSLGPFYPNSDFSLSWSGSDTSISSTSILTSGIANFDIEYKEGDDNWQNLASFTSSTSIIFNKEVDLETNVIFRARARDNALNVSEWTEELTTKIGTDHLVISEIKVSGKTANDEFIELYNPTNENISLSNYSIQYRGSNSTSFKKKNFVSSNEILAKGYFIITSKEYTGSVITDMSHSTFSLSGSGGTIFLVSDQELLTDITATSTKVVDRMSYGDGNYLFPEDVAYEIDLSSTQSLERKAMASSTQDSMEDSESLFGNAYDFDDNSNDFVVQDNPSFQNYYSPIEPLDSDLLYPGVINSLVAKDITTNSIKLTWNTPKNANVGGGANYELRFKEGDCDLQISWLDATQVELSDLPIPLSIDEQVQSVEITSLLDEQSYCFGMRVFNGEFWSNLSNQISVSTTKDVILKVDQEQTDYNKEILFGSNMNKYQIKNIYQSFIPQVDNIAGIIVKVCRKYFNDIKDLEIVICKGDSFSGSGCDGQEVAKREIGGSDTSAIGLCGGPQEITIELDQDYSIIPGEVYHIYLGVTSYNTPYSPAFKTVVSTSTEAYPNGRFDTRKKKLSGLEGYDLWFKTLYR